MPLFFIHCHLNNYKEELDLYDERWSTDEELDRAQALEHRIARLLTVINVRSFSSHLIAGKVTCF